MTVAWTGYIDVTIEPAEPSQVRNPDERTVTATVTLSGAWRGAVMLICAEALAIEIASTLYKLDPADVTQADLSDITGELCNIVAGHMRALIPENTELGLPVVVDGTDYWARIPRGAITMRRGYRISGYPVGLAVMETEAREGSDAGRAG